MNISKIILLAIGLLLFQAVQAQFYGEIFDKNRNKNNSRSMPRRIGGDFERFDQRAFNRYDFDAYYAEADSLREMELAKMDSIVSNRQKIGTSPEELRKLGVNDTLIAEIVRLNELQDSLKQLALGLAAKQKSKNATAQRDSISFDELDELIQKQKDKLIEKAFSLPEAAVYGHEFFRKNLVHISKENEIKLYPPDNYVLGKGDRLNITMWGRADFNAIYTIDDYGAITVPLAGKIYLEGITYAASKKLLQQKMEQFYGKDANQLEITLVYANMISVHVVGEVFNPGTYRFPSVNSAFNVLVAMEGPNQIGSVRNINIQRGDKKIADLDVYQYLLNPDSRQDFFLTNNDYIFVPPLGKVVHIKGEVRRSHSYELKDGEGLFELLDFAGGLRANAYTKNINIKRFVDNREVLVGVNLDSLRSNKSNFALLNGDSIFVSTIPNSLRNYVEVMGAARVPGRYQLNKGNRISDVLYKAEGPMEEADLDRAYVLRLDEDLQKVVHTFSLKEVLLNQNSPDNILLQPLDTIHILSKRDFRKDYTVNISGEVNTPGEYQYAEGMTLLDLINWSGGFKREAGNSRLEVSRMVQIEGRSSLIKSDERIIMKRVDIDENLKMDSTNALYLLKPFDRISVRRSPDFELQQNIVIYGEIYYPGEYSLIRKDDNVGLLIERAGGVTPFAFQEGTRLYRKEDSLGYVLLNLEDVLRRPKKSRYNYVLTEGDSLYIPKITDIVTLQGAIGFFDVEYLSQAEKQQIKTDSLIQISVPYFGKKSARRYIEKYGAGYNRYGKHSRTYVQMSNGEVRKARNYWFFVKYPKVERGATVFVDVSDRKKFEKERSERRKNRNWNDAFDSFSSKIATILTIFVLVQQASK